MSTVGRPDADRSRILRVSGPLVEVGCPAGVAMHDLIALGADRLPGEVVAIRGDTATVQAYEYTGGLAPGHPAEPLGVPLSVRLAPDLLGGVFDGLLRPLADSGDLLTTGGPATAGPGRASWPFTPRVERGSRVVAGAVLGEIGGRVPLRLLVPPGLSGEVGWIAPEGEHPPDAVLAEVDGRQVRMAQRWPVRRPRPVVRRLPAEHPEHRPAGCRPAVSGGPRQHGRRPRRLRHRQDHAAPADRQVVRRGRDRLRRLRRARQRDGGRHRGAGRADRSTQRGRLAERTVTIANTSNMPMMAREASVHTGATVAEYFRDMGLDVVLIADSTSRWAEALREFASRMGELPAEEGYPAGLASQLAAFYERAAAVRTLGGATGSVTVIGAVSPPGGDRTEPVTAHTERVVRCLWSLDRELAYARHYPAVSWSESFSRDAIALGIAHARAGDPGWAERRGRVARQLASADRLADLVELVGITALPPRERIDVLAGRLLRESAIQQNALSPADAYSTPRRRSPWWRPC